METSPEAAAAAAATDPPARTFSQVVFIDIPYSYPPSSPITCRFTLNAAFQPNPRDWVGIFKVGWSSTKDYHTFVWVEAVHDAQLPEMRQAVFKEYYLPKDEIEYYQFCYIDSSGQVRGASTPFCFKNPSEQNTESIADDDLLVITTQEHVEQSQREKAELQKQLDLMRAENETLKSALLKDQNEISSSKDQNDQTEAEMAKLIKEMDQVKEHNEKLKNTLQLQMKENDRLKVCHQFVEEMVIEMTKRMEIQKQNSTEQEKLSSLSSRSNEEKYDRAVMKINQMKEEREELKGKLDAQSDEISKLKAKLREAERELTNALDRFQLQQVDLQSTTKEKDRISLELQKLQSVKGNMDEVRRENQELSRRLSQQDSLERAPKDDLTAQCQTLSMQLQDAQAKLLAEREETRAVTRQCEFTENELRDMQARELNKMLADKDISIQEKEHEIRLVKQERDELSREVQVLKGDVERLRSHYANLTSPVAEEMPYLQPDPIVAGSDIPAVHDQQDILGQQEHIYNTIGEERTRGQAEPKANLTTRTPSTCELNPTVSPAPLISMNRGGATKHVVGLCSGSDSLLVTPDEEPALVCRHCRESFPGITHPELEQHEQSHRVCPFCTMICDSMEQSIFEDHVYGHELVPIKYTDTCDCNVTNMRRFKGKKPSPFSSPMLDVTPVRPSAPGGEPALSGSTSVNASTSRNITIHPQISLRRHLIGLLGRDITRGQLGEEGWQPVLSIPGSLRVQPGQAFFKQMILEIRGARHAEYENMEVRQGACCLFR
ncbi:hypothetical protein CCH79_00003345 [Gambusia affinis]|uniref:SKICH domain-containing protein n=1 Tax=Gambusia affinis TaxID=33528 RepID=A0A315VEV2_GAMAF|nr:hypothetical protein CCH79_00003345 [Gambusia affinis]